MHSRLVKVMDDLVIPISELHFTVSRSSKPGGQNVNKVSTRVTLRFNVCNSEILSETQKQSVLTALRTRITKAGELVVTSQRYRTLKANRSEVTSRFTSLLRDALTDPAERIQTRMPEKEKQKRMTAKKHRSKLKATRSPVRKWDEE
jgi:ribosome-associated protein